MSDRSEEYPLPQRLQNDAMAERPPFSMDVHRQIMRRITDPRAQKNPWAIRLCITAAAAALLLATTLFLLHFKQPHERPAPQNPTEIAKATPTPPEAHPAPIPSIELPLTVNINGVMTATFDPADITLNLSILSQPNPPQPDHSAPSDDNPPAALASPEWLFACLTAPASRVQSTLSDVLPFDFRLPSSHSTPAQ